MALKQMDIAIYDLLGPGPGLPVHIRHSAEQFITDAYQVAASRLRKSASTMDDGEILVMVAAEDDVSKEVIGPMLPEWPTGTGWACYRSDRGGFAHRFRKFDRFAQAVETGKHGPIIIILVGLAAVLPIPPETFNVGSRVEIVHSKEAPA